MADYTEAQLKEALDKQKQELQAEFDDKIKGLKATNEALKAEKKELAKKNQEELEAKEKEAIEAAKKAGELEKAAELERAQHERKLQQQSEQLEQRNKLILSSKKEAAVSGIVKNFAKTDKLSQLTASQLVDFDFDETGQVVSRYKDLEGNVVADNQDKWLEWAKSDPDMQNHLAGSKASGPDPSKVRPTGEKKPDEFDRQAKAEEINARLN